MHGQEQTVTEVIFVEIFKKAAFGRVHHFLHIILDIILSEVDTSTYNSACQTICCVYIPEAVSKSFDNTVLVSGLDVPYLKGFIIGAVGVLYIENVVEIHSAAALSHKGNTFRSAIDTTVQRLFVPSVEVRASGSKGALSVDQHLVFKRILVLI